MGCESQREHGDRQLRGRVDVGDGPLPAQEGSRGEGSPQSRVVVVRQPGRRSDPGPPGTAGAGPGAGPPDDCGGMGTPTDVGAGAEDTTWAAAASWPNRSDETL
jgi:hypothetical protein